jgi:hypothetical protein
MTVRVLPGGHDIVREHDRPMQCCLILQTSMSAGWLDVGTKAALPSLCRWKRAPLPAISTCKKSEGRAALVPTSSHPADMLVCKLGSIAQLSDEERRAGKLRDAAQLANEHVCRVARCGDQGSPPFALQVEALQP